MTLLPTPEDAFEWGRRLGASLQAGDVIALCGNLGAGKTQAVKGIMAGAGSRHEASSPTFTLVHEHHDGRLPVFHLDFYRMSNAREVLSAGWDELLDEPAAVVVEWADLFPELMPPRTRWFHIEILPEGGRRVMEKTPAE
ncbi:MAG TPA: tRNA (adenosine(37)-N6)-threonylcarbamoyltransferase complex ATPase subunit type 1 TsaE [Prosthecobacter sp.]|nr:tRNA (adenosine(37)-N6)-threonylcarbamoyltransferase complex ATPase subunit type 1 TsaE [Prosthecobacter sp.]HRK16824.1 tRNA (adenosine(37)-N6)-threonylcarbamoyltransferase complex ATPase subunit type 1 TsaE [Prosthecobacter sp.]